MRRTLGLLMAAILFATLPAVMAGDDRRSLQLTGFFTDEWCGKSNANPEGAECARRCAAKGSAMAFYAGGKLYKIRKDDKQKAVDNVGVELHVTAVMQDDGTIKIDKIEKACKS